MGVGALSSSLGDLKGKADGAKQAVDGLKGAVASARSDLQGLKKEVAEVQESIRNIGGAIVEAVRLSGEATASLQANQVQLYEIQKAVVETKKVSRDTLDEIEKLIEAKLPGMRNSMGGLLQQASEGKLSLEDLLSTITNFIQSPGVAQLSGAMPGYIGNLQDFAQAFANLEQKMKDADGAAGAAAGSGGGSGASGADPRGGPPRR